MNAYKKLFTLWVGSVIFISIMSICFLFMPMAVDIANDNRKRDLVIVGMIFWISLLIGYLLWILASIQAKKIILIGQQMQTGNKSKNKPRIVMDCIFILALLNIAILILLKKTEIYLIYIDISLLIFTVHMHGLLSGKKYKILFKKRSETKDE